MPGRNYAMGVQLWGNGTSAPPHYFTTDQSGAVSQDTAHAIPGRPFSAKLTRASVAGSAYNSHLSINMHAGIWQRMAPLEWWRNRTMTCSALVTFTRPGGSPHLEAIATFTDARLEKQSAPHTGDGSTYWLDIPTRTVASDAPQVVLQMGLVTGDNPLAAEGGECYVHGFTCVEGAEPSHDETSIYDLREFTHVLTSNQPGIGPNIPADPALKVRRLGVGWQSADDSGLFLPPYPCVVTDFGGRVSSPPGSGKNCQYDFIHNGSAVSGMSATISGATATKVRSDGNTHRYVGGDDLIGLQATVSGDVTLAIHNGLISGREVLPPA